MKFKPQAIESPNISSQNITHTETPPHEEYFINISNYVRPLSELSSKPYKANNKKNMNHTMIETNQTLLGVCKTIAWSGKLGPRLGSAMLASL
jgi:hypothetical protein